MRQTASQQAQRLLLLYLLPHPLSIWQMPDPAGQPEMPSGCQGATQPDRPKSRSPVYQAHLAATQYGALVDVPDSQPTGSQAATPL